MTCFELAESYFFIHVRRSFSDGVVVLQFVHISLLAEATRESSALHLFKSVH